jgi:hypothetical protein
MPPELLIQNNTLAWRIRARFSGGLPPHEYLSPDIRHSNPGWGDEIFNRKIQSLEFFLPTGHRLMLSGMMSFNFFVEASQSSTSDQARIEAFWFCGRLPCSDIVEMWRIGNSLVVRKRAPWGQEWGGGPTSGWKPGSFDTHTISMLMEGH